MLAKTNGAYEKIGTLLRRQHLATNLTIGFCSESQMQSVSFVTSTIVQHKLYVQLVEKQLAGACITWSQASFPISVFCTRHKHKQGH